MLSKKLKLAKEAEYDAEQKQIEWSIKAEAAIKERVKQAVGDWVNNDQDRSKTFTFPLIPFHVEDKSIFDLGDVSTILKRAADSACNTVYDPEYELKNELGIHHATPSSRLVELCIESPTYEVVFKIVERAVRLVTDRQLTVERAARAEKYATELADIEAKIKAGLDKWGHQLQFAAHVNIYIESLNDHKERTHLVFDAAANVCHRENKYPDTNILEYNIVPQDLHSYFVRVNYRLTDGELARKRHELEEKKSAFATLEIDSNHHLIGAKMSQTELARKRLEA
jgi:hypothetical protein